MCQLSPCDLTPEAYSNAATDHLYTISAIELQSAMNQGYTFEGQTGYVFFSQQPGTVALYRIYSAGRADHLYTTSAVERDTAAGFTLEFLPRRVLWRPASVPLVEKHRPPLHDIVLRARCCELERICI
jgi:hypothetical protein